MKSKVIFLIIIMQLGCGIFFNSFAQNRDIPKISYYFGSEMKPIDSLDKDLQLNSRITKKGIVFDITYKNQKVVAFVNRKDLASVDSIQIYISSVAKNKKEVSISSCSYTGFKMRFQEVFTCDCLRNCFSYEKTEYENYSTIKLYKPYDPTRDENKHPGFSVYFGGEMIPRKELSKLDCKFTRKGIIYIVTYKKHKFKALVLEKELKSTLSLEIHISNIAKKRAVNIFTFKKSFPYDEKICVRCRYSYPYSEIRLWPKSAVKKVEHEN